MRTLGIASISVAALMATALIGAKPADARGGGGRGMSFSSHSSSSSSRSTSSRSVTRSSNKTFKSVTKTNTSMRRAVVHRKPHIDKVAKVNKQTLKKGTVSGFVNKGTLGSGKFALGKLPVVKAAAGNAHLVGRLNVPKNFKPKLTLAHAPNGNLKLRLAPFVQRHWKKSFFWVAVAGLGYITVPELYYDRFYRCAGVDDPDYEGCISVLSYAALEEEDQMVGRVRTTMPGTAAYRYTAKVEPAPEAKQTCSLEPFVDRQWNRSFVWVQIPQTGNVTVPEDYYDRFYGKVGGEPPNYVAACQVLVEAAAADTVATTAPDLNPSL
jgi:hypothetical protein